MDCSNEISSSKDEFDFSLLKNKITSIHEPFDDKVNENNDKDSDKVRGVRRRKIKIIDSECESDSNTAEDTERSEWICCTESEEIPSRIQFVPDEKPAGPQIPSNKRTS